MKKKRIGCNTNLQTFKVCKYDSYEQEVKLQLSCQVLLALLQITNLLHTLSQLQVLQEKLTAEGRLAGQRLL